MMRRSTPADVDAWLRTVLMELEEHRTKHCHTGIPQSRTLNEKEAPKNTCENITQKTTVDELLHEIEQCSAELGDQLEKAHNTSKKLTHAILHLKAELG